MDEPPVHHDSEAGDMPRSSRARSMVARWEALPARFQLLAAWVGGVIVLGLVHVPFVLSGNISVMRACGYALGESLPLALLVTLATQMERARKLQAPSVDEHRPPPGI